MLLFVRPGSANNALHTSQHPMQRARRSSSHSTVAVRQPRPVMVQHRQGTAPTPPVNHITQARIALHKVNTYIILMMLFACYSFKSTIVLCLCIVSHL